jgi:hypothetical protein
VYYNEEGKPIYKLTFDADGRKVKEWRPEMDDN